MSASKSKSKQTTNETQTTSGTSTTTPTTPDWLAQPWQDYTQSVTNLMSSDEPLISGASDLQNQAFSAASNLNTKSSSLTQPQTNGGSGDGYTSSGTSSSSTPSNYDLATALTVGAGTSGANLASDPSTYQAATATSQGFTQEGLQERLSPYLQEVVDTTLADYDYSAGQTRKRATAQAAANGGLRNSNGAILLSQTNDSIDRGRASTAAELRDQGYRTAAEILAQDNDRALQASLANASSENQARQFNANAQNTTSQFNAGQEDNALNRALEAAGLLSNIGTAQGADTRSNIELQADLGAQQRDIENETSEASQTALIAQLLGYIPEDLFTGSTTTQNTTSTGNRNSTGSSSSYGFNLSDWWSPSGGLK